MSQAESGSNLGELPKGFLDKLQGQLAAEIRDDCWLGNEYALREVIVMDGIGVPEHPGLRDQVS